MWASKWKARRRSWSFPSTTDSLLLITYNLMELLAKKGRRDDLLEAKTMIFTLRRLLRKRQKQALHSLKEHSVAFLALELKVKTLGSETIFASSQVSRHQVLIEKVFTRLT